MMLAALVLLAVWLRRAVGAPADALRSASGRLAGGDLETPVTLSVDNELGAVASDLETMRRRLAGRMEALERLRHLSAQVVGATSLQRLTEVALALVPLLSRGRFLGLLALCWTERHQLDREQEALLGLAGNQIAGALEAALRLEEAERAAGEARAVFYAIADGVLLTDPFGRVTAMNRALEALTGWTETDARGRPYAEVLPIATDQVGGPADLVSRYGRRVPVAVSSAPSSTPEAGSSAGST